MSDVDTTREIASRVKRQTTNRDILALCDAVLALRGECPVCVKRRRAKAESQKRWRRCRRNEDHIDAGHEEDDEGV